MDKKEIIIEPFRIKSVQSIRMNSYSERLNILEKSHLKEPM